MTFWGTMSDAQATVIAALLTILAAMIGVVLGWLLFGAKVRDLSTALEESRRLIEDHRSAVTTTLEMVSEKIGGLDEQVAALLSKAAAAEEQIDTVQAQNVQPGDLRELIKDGWETIRDRIERIAADPQIDGRTRAKYGRLDRRHYGWLLDSLEEDRRLPNADRFREAMALWYRFKSNRVQPTQADLDRMNVLREALTPREAS